MGLHIHLDKVFEDNAKKVDVLRKNNFIVNNEDNPTRE